MSSAAPETADQNVDGSFLTDVTDFSWWRKLFERVVVFASQNPGTFLYYVMLGLTPIFLASAVLSWKLAKHLEKEEKDKKRKGKREAGIAKARSNAVASAAAAAAAAANDKSSPTPSKNAKTPPQQSAKNKGRQKGHSKRE